MKSLIKAQIFHFSMTVRQSDGHNASSKILLSLQEPPINQICILYDKMM